MKGSAAIDSTITQGAENERGYLHPDYARAFSEFGRPLRLECSRGWMLVREIKETQHFDAMGCYPFFTCQDWYSLPNDIEALKASCVSVTMVTDPFGVYSESDLRVAFPDLFIRFKQHHVIDLSKPAESYVSRHHQRYARKALQQIGVERYDNPGHLIDEWIKLYDVIVRRHQLLGILAFSRSTFSRMLQVPGMVVFRAVKGKQTVCMQLWYEQGGVAYYHLGASNSMGYECKAAFALFWRAIDYFSKRGLKWIGLGGGAGLHEAAQNGLSRFKSGWANSERDTYLCGRILNHEVYRRIHMQRGGRPTGYFPAYRQGEF